MIRTKVGTQGEVRPITAEQQRALKQISANWQRIPGNFDGKTIRGLETRGLIELKEGPGYVKHDNPKRQPPLAQTHLCRLVVRD